jgi:hypothetical protein
MGMEGSVPLIKGLRHEPDVSLSSSTNERIYNSSPIICPSGMHKESFTFMVCRRKLHCPLHAEKIQFLNRKYLFSVLHYARNHSCGELFFIYVYTE